jgi:hypothetical protein
MGRPITVHTRRAQQKRESMRRARERARQEQQAPNFEIRTLARVMQQWRMQ